MKWAPILIRVPRTSFEWFFKTLCMYRICFWDNSCSSPLSRRLEMISQLALFPIPSHTAITVMWCAAVDTSLVPCNSITLRSIQLLSFLTIFPPFMQLNVQQSLLTRSKTVQRTMHYYTVHREMISHYSIYSSFILTKVSYSDNVDKLLEHYLLIKSTFKEKYK